MNEVENYLTRMKHHLEIEITDVLNGQSKPEAFVRYVLEEIRGSFKRGLAVGRGPQKSKTRPQKKTNHYKS